MLKKISPVFILSLFILQCDIPTATDHTPPTVVIVYPTEGTVISADTQIRIEAYDDELKKVWAYVDEDLIGETKDEPYVINLDVDPYQDGLSHTLQVFASDKTGNINGSGAINIIIAKTKDIIDPTVAIVNPQTGQTVEGTVRIVAVADDERSVQKVAFFVDGDSIAVDNSYPYFYDWDTKPYADSTNHTIYAKAFDSGNNSGTSTVVTVTVYPSTDITPPQAIMTYPIGGQVVFDTVTVSVEAADNKGLAMVEFFIDGQLKFTDNQAPYQFEWDTTPYADGGSHALYAKAYDLSGNTTTTAINTVTVSSLGSDDITAPSVIALYPVNLSTVSGTITIRADAQDNIAVSRVEFYVDGVLNGTDNNGSDGWSSSWNTASQADSSSHSVFIKAFDAAGNTGTAFITVTVIP